MIKISNSTNPSKGFVLLPLLIMLLCCSLILISLSQNFYNHITLSKETELYFNAQNQNPKIEKQIEQQLSILSPKPASPIDESQLLNQINTWPSFEIDNQTIHNYNQLIQQTQDNLFYVSLINISDTKAEQRLIEQLISICSLADHHCHPVELTLIQ